MPELVATESCYVNSSEWHQQVIDMEFEVKPIPEHNVTPSWFRYWASLFIPVLGHPRGCEQDTGLSYKKAYELTFVGSLFQLYMNGKFILLDHT